MFYNMHAPHAFDSFDALLLPSMPHFDLLTLRLLYSGSKLIFVSYILFDWFLLSCVLL